MHKTIMNNLWQVGGSELTDSADAAVYLIRFDDRAALVDAGCGGSQAQLVANVKECLPPEVDLEYLLLTHCHFDHTGGAEKIRNTFGCRIVAMPRMQSILKQAIIKSPRLPGMEQS